jgi:hypothetical protein
LRHDVIALAHTMQDGRTERRLVEAEGIARAVDPQFWLNARHRGSLIEDSTVPPAVRRVGRSPDGAVDAVQGEAEPSALVSGFLMVVSATRAMTCAPHRRLNSLLQRL